MRWLQGNDPIDIGAHLKSAKNINCRLAPRASRLAPRASRLAPRASRLARASPEFDALPLPDDFDFERIERSIFFLKLHRLV